ncbi:restriction endonuclease subunit S [Pseudomonas sp. MF6747]|uniref:restriction endonuclease subunit S n=1 Tax=Pseudomonas sp. MF6747 TaxID=2797527 RepID=UPI00190E0785|nr:restriction endonuclease subunit S [Pseudomonas sp. MF6747]MBK3507654.1 restriction endonuclease subunit S [Pseudomonas sp. MF6747]
MSDLSFVPLTRFADVTMGQSPGAELCNTDGKGLPFLQGCAEFGASNPQTSVFCDPPLRTAKAGSVLISVRAPVGTMNYADQDYCIGRGLGSFKAKPGLSNTVFLKHAVEHCSGYLHRRSQGSTFAAVSTGDVQTIPIPVFTFLVQNKIAKILIGIDTAIEKTEHLIAKYLQIKAGLMRDLFTRGVLPNGLLRPFEKSVQTPFGKMPSEWRLGSILELTDSQRQPILTGPFGADLGSSDFVAEGIPVLRIGNVQQGRLDLDDLLYVSVRKAATLSRYRIKNGDLLFARQGATTGRNALADERVEGFLINYHVIRVALDHGRCSPLFVEAAFANEIVMRQIERDKGRGTREGINTAQLTSLAFPIAPLAEQRLIAGILSKHNRFLLSAEAKLQVLQKQKRGLVQDLLTGKVPVKVDAPETADA